jgi:hypothetical protein
LEYRILDSNGGACEKIKAGPAQGTWADLAYIQHIFWLVDQFVADILVVIRGKGGPSPIAQDGPPDTPALLDGEAKRVSGCCNQEACKYSL